MFKKSNLLSYCYRCGLPVCNEVCEEGPLHKNNECPLFAKAFDNSDDEYDNKEGHAKSSKLPKIENLHAPCPLYTCITPLRLLLREWNAEKNNTELVSLFIHVERLPNFYQRKFLTTSCRETQAKAIFISTSSLGIQIQNSKCFADSIEALLI